jgi:glycosyltransferase involved in cell wall biosynthesis
MTPRGFRWLVLAGGLSPYTLDLWEEVAGVPGHSVTLFHVPRPRLEDFTHEEGQLQSCRVSVVEARGLWSAREVLVAVRDEPPDVIVCMGHVPAYKAVASAILRVFAPRTRPVLAYMSDTNGLDLLHRVAVAPHRLASLAIRGAVLGSLFDASFDLGTTNSVAHRLVGVRVHVDLPLLAVRSPLDPEALPVPPETQSRLAQCLEPRLVCAARHAPVKNLIALTRAWAHHVARGGSGSLSLAGDGPVRSAIEAAAEALPRDRIGFLGAIPFRQARSLMCSFAGSVLVSTYEPWGIAVVESLMAGVPVLASHEVGAAWSLAPLAPGAIAFTATSETALRSALSDYVSNLPRHQAAARLAAPAIRERFELREVARRLVAMAPSLQGLRRQPCTPG